MAYKIKKQFIFLISIAIGLINFSDLKSGWKALGSRVFSDDVQVAYVNGECVYAVDNDKIYFFCLRSSSEWKLVEQCYRPQRNSSIAIYEDFLFFINEYGLICRYNRNNLGAAPNIIAPDSFPLGTKLVAFEGGLYVAVGDRDNVIWHCKNASERGDPILFEWYSVDCKSVPSGVSRNEAMKLSICKLRRGTRVALSVWKNGR